MTVEAQVLKDRGVSESLIFLLVKTKKEKENPRSEILPCLCKHRVFQVLELGKVPENEG